LLNKDHFIAYIEKWFFSDLKNQTVSYEKSIIAIAFLRNKSGTFPLNILQYKFQEETLLITALIVLNLNFPWTHVPKPATRVNGTA
jgi:hypothetical protein